MVGSERGQRPGGNYTADCCLDSGKRTVGGEAGEARQGEVRGIGNRLGEFRRTRKSTVGTSLRP